MKLLIVINLFFKVFYYLIHNVINLEKSRFSLNYLNKKKLKKKILKYDALVF
jgi:hypothetical protein